jgi:hypothetical protein
MSQILAVRRLASANCAYWMSTIFSDSIRLGRARNAPFDMTLLSGS